MPTVSQHVLKTGLKAAVAISLLGAAAVAQADDWPQWRGPNRDGVWRETFSRGQPKVCWRAPVGPGWSSPVVARGRVYLTDSQLMRPQAKERVHCFDEATGKSLWTHAYEVTYPDWAFDFAPGRGPTATPIIDAGKLYTVGNKGDLCCLDALKGEVLWRRNLERDYHVQEFAFNASPLIEGNLLILCIGSYPGTMSSAVVALGKDSGKETWKTPTEGLTNSSPIVITAGGKRQVVVWTQGSVTSLNPATGALYWQERMNTPAASAVATPVFSDNFLLVSGLMLKLDPERPAARMLWPNSKAMSRRILSNTSTAVLQNGYVFSARSSGELVCMEASTGKQVWVTDQVTRVEGGASVHLTANGDGIFLHTHRGDLIQAELSGKGYKEIRRDKLLAPVAGQKAWPAPAFANCHVFARNDKELICASLAAKP
jgi:outer membrane protein assembly factor BamB